MHRWQKRYGRLHANVLPDLINAIQQNQIPLDYLRGRVGYTAVVQQAEYYLRQITNQFQANAFRFLQISQEGDVTAVQFMDNTDLTHHIRLRPGVAPIQIQPGCGQPTPKTISIYQFLSHSSF